MDEDYYALLGVDTDASEEAILRAYRKRAAEHHPDVSDEADAGETIRRLNRAKAVLTDDERRRAYDRLGHDRFVEREADAASEPVGADDREPYRHPPESPHSPRWPAGLGSMVERFYDSGLGSAAASSRPSREAAQSEPWTPIEVDLESLFERGGWSGSETPIGRADAGPSMAGDGVRRTCPKCGGRGTFVHVIDTARRRRLEPCERCGGSGTVPA